MHALYPLDVVTIKNRRDQTRPEVILRSLKTVGNSQNRRLRDSCASVLQCCMMIGICKADEKKVYRHVEGEEIGKDLRR